jgi:predicted phage tail protein
MNDIVPYIPSTIKLVKIQNPFNPAIEKTTDILEYRGESLLELRNKNFPLDIGVIVSVNGGIVLNEELSYRFVNCGDVVLFKPIIEGGNDGLRMIAMLALTAVAIILAVPSGGTSIFGLGSVYGAGVSAGMAAMISMGTMMVGGFLINALLPPTIPDIDDYMPGLASSNTYSWNATTQQRQGLVIPRPYGLSKLYGNIISTYQESISDKNYINALMSLGYGPVNRIYDHYINDQPAAGFDGVEIHSRLGLLTQEVIPNFNDTKTQYSTNVKVTYDNSYTYITTGNAFDGLEVDVTFPRGLYYSNDQGGLSSMSVKIGVEIQLQGQSTWAFLSQEATQILSYVTTGRWSKGFWVESAVAGIPGSWKETGIGSSITTDHYDGETVPNLVDWYVHEIWRWITTQSESYTTTTVNYVTVTDAKNSTIIKTFKSASNLTHGIYNIRITRLTADYISTRYGADSYLSAVREIVTDDFTYPRSALVGIKALASDQLSGALDFSCMCEGAKVMTYSGGVGSFGYSSNPAWVCLDVLTQPVFTDLGAIARYDGIDIARIDITSFETWATWCDQLVDDGKGTSTTEKRFEFNGIFDSEMTLWEAALQICAMARAILIDNGTKYTIVIDKAVTLATDVDCLFSMGNIYQDSFTESFLSMEERTGELEISFVDKDSGYEKGTFTVFNTTLNRPSNRTSVLLIGTTKASQAWRMGTFTLAQNEHIRRRIAFDADLDAISVTVGDVFYFAHDVPQWGLVSGRVVSATSTSITLDESAIIEAAKTYAITVWLGNDTLVTKTITNMPGTYTTLNISGSWTDIPDAYNSRYVFGESSTIAKPFRVLDVSRESDQKCTINACEYEVNVYSIDTGTPDLPTINYSNLVAIAPVTELALKEVVEMDESGNINRSIAVTFKKPVNAAYKQGNIYYREYPDGSWKSGGSTADIYHLIKSVKPYINYEVTVISESYAGIKTTFAESPKALLYTTGISTSSTYSLDIKVSGLHIDGTTNGSTFTGKDCRFHWNDTSVVDTGTYKAGNEPYGAGYSVPALWFKDYQVEIYDSMGTLRRTEYVGTNFYVYTYEKNYEDGLGIPLRTFEVRVRVRDKYGRMSFEPASLTATNPSPAAPTNIITDGYIKAFIVRFDQVNEHDMDGYKIWAHTVSGFTPSETYVIYKGKDNRCLKENIAGGYWYVKVAAYDTFGDTGLNYSGEYTVAVSTLDPLDIIPPAVPTGLGLASTLEETAQTNTANIIATWTANTEADFSYYVLRLKRGSESNYVEVYSETNSYKFKGLITNIAYSVYVSAVDKWNNASAFCSVVTITTAADTTPPVVPTGLTVTAGIKSVMINFTANTESDLAGYEVHVSTVNGFTPDSGTLKAKGLSTLLSFDGAVNTTYYVKVRSFDWSGNYSAYCTQASATTTYVTATDINNFAITASKIWAKIPILESDSWSDNSPSGGYVAWNSHNLYYNGVLYTIAAGNTTNKYIYWDGSSSAYSTSNTNPTLVDGQFIIATNVSGAHDLAWNAIANQVIGSAYIQDAAIINAKIGSLAVDTANIALAAITNAKIGLLAVQSANINDCSVSKLTAGTITADNILLTDSKFTISGVNQQMIISDTSRQRVKIGKLGAGAADYGIMIYNDAGTAVFDSHGDVTRVASLVITNDMLAGSIVAAKLNVSSLSAIAADLGTITSGIITISTTSHIKGGQTAYMTGTGFYLGYSTDAYKFSIGDSVSKYVAFNGTDLVLGKDSKFVGTDCYNNDGIFWHTNFESIDGFENKENSPTISTASLLLIAPATVNDVCGLTYIKYNQAIGVTSWQKARKFKASVTWSYTCSNYTSWVGTGVPYKLDGSAGYRFLAFYAINNVLYGKACNNDGSYSSVTLVNPISMDVVYKLECVFTPGSDAKFYVNDSLLGTLTTCLPNTSAVDNCRGYFGAGLHKNYVDANPKYMYVSEFAMSQEG